MAENKTIYIIAVAIFAGLTLVAVALNINKPLSTDYDGSAYAQTIIGIRQNIISVTGIASQDVTPDQAVINFGVVTQATTAAEASQRNAVIMNSVVEAVKDLGITEREISTPRFTIWPNYDSAGRVIVGYTASNILSVKTNQVDLASQIIDATTSSGANRVENISFTLSSELEKNVRDELIEAAVNDARMKAQKALTPLGKQIIGVKSVTLSEFGIPPPIIPFDMFREERVGAPTPIFTSDQQVSTSVSVIFLID